MTGPAEKIWRYPLGAHHRDEIATNTGRKLSDIDLAGVASGSVRPDDVTVSAASLMVQAGFAREAGHAQLAENLIRAAEMTRIPSATILEIYEAMRPGRSSYYQLLSLSQQIASQYDAEHTGAYIREAAEAYRDTGMLRDET